MFRNKWKLSHRLESVLLQYERIANSTPSQLRSLIPPNEVWRFFVDGERQSENTNLDNCFKGPILSRHTLGNYELASRGTGWNALIRYLHLSKGQMAYITLSDLVKFNKGWFLFEVSEPGYLKALYHAFKDIFDTDQKLNLKFVQHLHKKAAGSVQHTNYEGESGLSKPGAIRTVSQIGFRLTSLNASVMGIKEILGRNDHFSTFFIGGIAINPFTLAQYIQVINELENIPQEFKALFSALAKSKDHQQYAEVLYDFIDKNETHDELKLYYVSMQNADNSEVELKDDAEEFIAEFNEEIIGATNPLARLSLIVWIIQRLEQLHMFLDLNCRTVCMLLLNWLLNKYGLPLAIQLNPNMFDAFSHEELMVAVIEGMENTMTLIEEGELYNVQTRDMLDLLKSSNSLGASSQYFEEVVKIEERARRRVNLSLFGVNKRKHDDSSGQQPAKKQRLSSE